MEGQGLLGPVGLVDGVVRLSGPTVSVNAGDRGKRKKVENTEERAEVRRLCEGLFERWSNKKRIRPRGTNNGFSAVVNISKL